MSRPAILVAAVCWATIAPSAPAEDASTLRLVPFPKQVRLRPGAFSLRGPLSLEVPVQLAELLARMINGELKRAGRAAAEVRTLGGSPLAMRLSDTPGGAAPDLQIRPGPTVEGYALEVRPEEVVCTAGGRAGLCHAAATLCQLIRANRRGEGLPCLTVRDRPSIRWRCFQDDLTRGPSSTLQTLRRQVDLGASLKMNLLTYYMEHQYAFKNHPIIGPKDGSLQPEELEALVRYAKGRQVEILGNQQSFGHFEDILKHPQYAGLRETASLLCPVEEESYRLLDDLYGEVCPRLPFEMFNVCCDETWGLGTGPSKPLAEKIGVGGVYVRHLRRVHDLLKDKYHKRMMMWGDIILQHPDRLDQIPKDTVMLTWGYGPRESFEDQILPFARSGFAFFVCPGISNWSRILPDFGTATVNIRNFVRDGARHGALGVLNTAWEDDGETLQGYKWHGCAWGAECAWNAATTTPDDFNRRIGAVLFGEKGDHFGRAIELLTRTHRLDGMQGMNNKRFWQKELPLGRSPAATRASARRLLQIVRPAIGHLQACKSEAVANADLLDYFLFGAERMELIGQRMLHAARVAEAYAEARRAAQQDRQTALSRLAEAEELVRADRHAHERLGRQFQRLWLAESKPYALDWTMRRYAEAVKRYDVLAARLLEARQRVEAGKPLLPPESLGLALPSGPARHEPRDGAEHR